MISQYWAIKLILSDCEDLWPNIVKIYDLFVFDSSVVELSFRNNADYLTNC